MKPKLIEWIPIYGMFKYYKRYFSGVQRGSREAYIATWFELYHISMGIFITMCLIKKMNII